MSIEEPGDRAERRSASAGCLDADRDRLVEILRDAAPSIRWPKGFAAQCRQAWANLAAALAHHGMGPSDLVKVTTYLSDRAYRQENSAIRHRYSEITLRL